MIERVSIRRLASLAYPTLVNKARESLAKDQFIVALFDPEVRIRIKQSRPKTLNEAVMHAVELDAYNKAENKSYTRSTIAQACANGDTSIQTLTSAIEKLRKQNEWVSERFGDYKE